MSTPPSPGVAPSRAPGSADPASTEGSGEGPAGRASSSAGPGPYAPLGFGVGLRHAHFGEWLERAPPCDFVEAISENFMIAGGRPLHVLEQVRRDRPVVLHGVSLSIGSQDPLDDDYLADLADLARRFEPAWVSDHLCWGRRAGVYAHDLLPLPYSEEALAHVIDRVRRVQDRLGRRILLENVSSYVRFADSTLGESEFLAAVAEGADCGLLLDVNNVYVSTQNHGGSALDYFAALPPERVGQMHLAGHSRHGALWLDTHDAPVPDPVWDLYRVALARFGPVATLVEWDDQIPPLERLLAESERARAAAREFLGGERASPG